MDATRWKTSWSGPKPFDRTKWHTGFDQNQCLSGFLLKPENVEVSGGTAKLYARKEFDNYSDVAGTTYICNNNNVTMFTQGQDFDLDYQYTSGTLTGLNEIGFQATHGLKIETRFKLPKGIGLWPAFWSFTGIEEIDFLEIWDTELSSTFGTTIHLNEGGQWGCSNNINIDLADGKFHKFVGEVTPNFIKIYVDDILVYVLNKYEDLNGNPVATDCGEVIPSGTLLSLEKFPNPDSWYAPLFTLEIQPDDAIAGLVGDEAVMEIDYVRTYQRKVQECAPAFLGDNYHPGDGEVWSNPNYQINSVTVDAGNTLTIQNSTVKVRQFDGIILEAGATLILDNTTLTSCRNQWNGISGLEEANIIIRNGSVIENAVTGIDGPMILDITNTTFRDNHVGINITGHSNPMNVVMDLCTFEINMTGIAINDRADGIFQLARTTFRNIELQDLGAIGIKFTNVEANAIIDVCEFHDSTIGLQANQSSDVNIHRSLFTQSNLTGNGIYYAGIESIESYINVTNDNRFEENYRGIDLQGTFPLSSGAQVGVKDQDHNTFERNWIAISAKGNDQPTGVNIINNEFDNTSNTSFSGIIGADFYGANLSIIENNSLTKMQSALVSSSTGGNFNRYNCNEYTDSYYSGNMINGDNNKTKILENDFSNPIVFTADINLSYGAHINESQQGATAADAAGNCFTKNGIDDILTVSTSTPFTYVWYDDSADANCQLPTTPGNYILPPIPTSLLPGNCENGIGTTQIVGGGGEIDITDIFTTIPDTPTFTDYDNACLPCIKDSIATWINQVINTGNDNPITYADDSSTSTDGGYSEEVLDDWINLALDIAIDNDNYTYAEQILTPLKKRRWQIRLFGIYVLSQDYVQAANILSSLPQNTLDEVYFHDVQRINIKRLTANDQIYVMNQAEDVRLSEIALAMQPSSGYAISLYRILKGEHLSRDYGYMTVPVTPRSQLIEKNEINVNIFPNPAISTVTVEVADQVWISSITVLDFNNKNLMHINSANNKQIVNIEQLPKGIYILKINLGDGTSLTEKILKL